LLDIEIREALCDYIESRRIRMRVRLIAELVIGRARADIVAVTDILTGYEIKGDGDSYVRLPGQIREYDGHFQRNYIVVGPSHRRFAASRVPPHWGILAAAKTRGVYRIEEDRESADNLDFSIKNQLRILWRPELISILGRNKLPLCSGRNKPYIIKFMLEKLDAGIIAAEVCAELFERDWTLAGR